MPRVSVITGFYNRGALLERTIRSILQQTYDDFELIVFDDASTDSTAAELERLATLFDDERFSYVIHEENTGFVQGMVDAIARSSGEFIAVQGSGDASLPDRLRLQVALLDSRPEVGAVGGWYYNVQEGLGTHRLRRPNADGMTFEQLLQGNVYSHGEVTMRRSTYEAAGGYRVEFKNAQDYDLWLRMRKLAELATVPAPIYDRYVQFDGVSYVPRKILTQSSYSVSARLLAQMSASEEEEALAVIREEGPTALAPKSHPEVQQKVTQAVIRLAVFGSPSAASELSKEGIVDPLRRRALTLFARTYGIRAFRPARSLVQKRLGLEARPAS